nr:hypothetical protein CFP56_14084 [Quercus suber]
MDEVSKWTAFRPIVMPEVRGVSIEDEPSCAGVTYAFNLTKASPAESVTIPHLSPLGEGLDFQGDMVRVGMPRVFDDIGERGVGELDGFEMEGSLAIIEGEWVCVDKDWVVVRRSSRKVEDICFFKEEFPMGVGKNFAKTLHNKACVSFVCVGIVLQVGDGGRRDIYGETNAKSGERGKITLLIEVFEEVYGSGFTRCNPSPPLCRARTGSGMFVSIEEGCFRSVSSNHGIIVPSGSGCLGQKGFVVEAKSSPSEVFKKGVTEVLGG